MAIVGLLLIIIGILLGFTGIGIIVGIPTGLLGLLLVIIAIAKGGVGAVLSIFRNNQK